MLSRCDVGKLKMDNWQGENFSQRFQNRIELLAHREEDRDMNDDWKVIKEMYTNTYEEVLGNMEKNKKMAYGRYLAEH